MRTARPRAGVHYPRSASEFQAWFPSDGDCLDYLERLHWPEGFVCPRCASPGGWAVADSRYKCVSCGAHTAITAGTLFDRRWTPLNVWLTTYWMCAAQKDGISTLSLQRALEIGSYPSAWAMLHRLRSVLVRPGRDLLNGTVDVEETWLGGKERGHSGRAKGKNILAGVAVGCKAPKKRYGRSQMPILTDASAQSLHAFITAHLEPGATVITDDWPSYLGIDRLGYHHEPYSPRAAATRGEDVGALLSGVHRIASLAKRWVLGTHQGGLEWASSRESTSLSSASTDVVRRASGFSSTEFSSWQSTTNRFVIDSWSPIRSRRRCHRSHPSRRGIRPASSGHRQIGHGGGRDLGQSRQLNTPKRHKSGPRSNVAMGRRESRMISWLMRADPVLADLVPADKVHPCPFASRGGSH